MAKKYKCASRSLSDNIKLEINKMIDHICEILDLTFDCVIKKNRSRECADARYIVVGIIRAKYGKKAPYCLIGKKFNRKVKNCHLFAMQANRTFLHLIEKDFDFRIKYDKVKDIFPHKLDLRKQIQQRRSDAKNQTNNP